MTSNKNDIMTWNVFGGDAQFSISYKNFMLVRKKFTCSLYSPFWLEIKSAHYIRRRIKWAPTVARPTCLISRAARNSFINFTHTAHTVIIRSWVSRAVARSAFAFADPFLRRGYWWGESPLRELSLRGELTYNFQAPKESDFSG